MAAVNYNVAAAANKWELDCSICLSAPADKGALRIRRSSYPVVEFSQGRRSLSRAAL